MYTKSWINIELAPPLLWDHVKNLIENKEIINEI